MNTLLIANRGEIAIRVMRTAQRLGWQHGRHPHRPRRRRARTCGRPTGRCGSSPTSTSTRSSRAAREAGAGFVHPGYGFLSERAPVRPGAGGGRHHPGRPERRRDGRDGPQGRRPRDRRGRRRARRAVVRPRRRPRRRFAYPVLVKAAAGGGGKGMRVVRTRRRAATRPWPRRRARRRARSATTPCSSRSTSSPAATSRCRSWATPTARCCTSSSATAPPSGATRRCSRRRPRPPSADRAAGGDHERGRRPGAAGRLHQRRHRGVPARQRHRRVLLPRDEHPPPGRAPGHRGGRPGADDRGASGSTSSSSSCASPPASRSASTQDDVTLEGHAIEARVYAEDSFNGFLPQAGRAGHVTWGADFGRPVRVGPCRTTTADPHPRRPRARVRAGGVDLVRPDARQGDRLGSRPRRGASAPRRGRSTGSTIMGLTTNTGFLRALADTDEFRDATIDTAWLDRHEVPAPVDARLARVLAALMLVPPPARTPGAGPVGQPTASGSAATRRRSWCGSTRSSRSPRPASGSARRARHGGCRSAQASAPSPRWSTASTTRPPPRGSETPSTWRTAGSAHVFVIPDPFADHGPEAGDGTLHRADARHRPRGQRRRGPGGGRG